MYGLELFPALSAVPTAGRCSPVTPLLLSDYPNTTSCNILSDKYRIVAFLDIPVILFPGLGREATAREVIQCFSGH